MGCAPSVHVCGQDHAVATRSAQEIAHVERAQDDAAERELLNEAPGVPSVLRPSSFGVGTRESPAEYDPTFLVRAGGSVFCQSTTRGNGRQMYSDFEASVPGPSFSPRKYFG